MTHIEEIPEADASPEIIAVYRDIKATIGAGLVNLIYRHWAAKPPALDWAWGALRPLFLAHDVKGKAESLVDGLDLPKVQEIPMEIFRAAVVGDHAVGTCADMVDAYNRANAQNLVVMPALARFIESGGAARPAQEPSSASPGDRPRDLPPIVAMEDMDVATRELVELLAAPVSSEDHPLVPSLYRHLAQWPPALALAAASSLLPAHVAAAQPYIKEAVERAEAGADALAEEMAPAAGCETPDEETLAEIAAAAKQFASGPIATMTVLGHPLRKALPNVKVMY